MIPRFTFQDISASPRLFLSTELDSGVGAVVLKDFPLDDGGQRDVERLVGFCSNLGQLAAQNHSGEIVGILGPGNPSWHQTQPFHVDGAKYLALLCVEQAWRGGSTRILSSIAISSMLKNQFPTEYELLCKPWPFWRKGRPGPDVFYRSIIHDQTNDFRFFYLPNTLRAVEDHTSIRFTDSERKALEALDGAIAGCPDTEIILLQRGDLLLLNNYRVLHSRDSYQDHPEGNGQRLLFRCWMNPAQK